MTLKTCQIQYEIAKTKGDAEAMKRWAARAQLHGGVIEEPKPEPVREPEPVKEYKKTKK